MFANYQIPVDDDEIITGRDLVLDAAVNGVTANVPICGSFSATASVPGATGIPVLLPSQQAILDQREYGQSILNNPSSQADGLLLVALCIGAYFYFRE